MDTTVDTLQPAARFDTTATENKTRTNASVPAAKAVDHGALERRPRGETTPQQIEPRW